MGHIPVISLSMSGIETNSGFKITPMFAVKAIQAVLYGDLFMRVVYKTRPYELNEGETDSLHKNTKIKFHDKLNTIKH